MNMDEPTPKVDATGRPMARAGTAASSSGNDVKTVRIPDEELSPLPRGEGSFVSETLADQYEIVEKIGDGGMGVVYLGRDRTLGRYVAIKRLHHNALGRAALKARFMGEAKAIAALNHIHIVHVYSLGEDEDGPYIVMEYVSGPGSRTSQGTPPPPCSLEDRIQAEGPFSLDDALELIVKVCRAVDYAHASGVIHRDLKPSNVLLDESGEPKIVDFGLARRATPGTAPLTAPGEKMLSLGYGAPEQESDAGQADERADVYGMGALLYFAITGQNPRYFRETDVPESVRTPILKALHTDRGQRWQSVKEFMIALTQVKTPSTVVVPTIKSTWRCKWCDKVNPLKIQYCGECGWDGRESCPECRAETRVGIQFCGDCGADARDYQMAAGLLERLKEHYQNKTYEAIVQQAGQISGFQPVGPAGRNVVKQVRDLRTSAERAMERRKQLKQLIAQELNAENFERARRYMQEYRRIADDEPFAVKLGEIPSLMLKRDLLRAKNFMAKREWDYAGQIAQNILSNIDPANDAARRIAARVSRRRWHARSGRALLAALLFLLLYVLSAPPLFRIAGATHGRRLLAFYKPVFALHDATALRGPLDKFADLWEMPDLYNQRARFLAPLEEDLPAAGPKRPAEVTELDAIYQADLGRIVAEYNRQLNTWPEEFRKALKAMMEKTQKAGDFDGWEAVRGELERFLRTPSISAEHFVAAPAELRALQMEYRALLAQYELDRKHKVLSLAKKHIHDLTSLQKTYTKAGKMAEAAEINTEIKRVEASDAFTEAVAAVAGGEQDHTADETTPPPAIPTPLPTTETVDQFAALRETHEKAMGTCENAYIQAMETWPDAYMKALVASMEDLQKAGDFEGWEAAGRELDRIETDRYIDDRVAADEPPALGALRDQYRRIADTHLLERYRKAVAQMQKYSDRLTQLQKDLTMAGKMEQATAVNAEIRRTRVAADTLAAELASLEGAKPDKPATPAE